MRSRLALILLLSQPAVALAQAGYAAVPDEPVPRTAEHFPETNEARHDVYFGAIDGLGGAYLGVGSDPNYTLAAAAGAERIVLVDYDPVVTRLHRALVALLAECDDAACLRARLTPEAETTSAARVAEALGEGWEAARTVRAFRLHRPLLAARVTELGETDSFVSRPDWYAHVRRLARGGRIVARTADLRGPTTLRAVARAARAEGEVFRVLYLSNAEEYFGYDDGFVANLRALPTDERSLVLRTFRDHRLPRPPNEHAWHYNVQPVRDLRARIRRGYADSSWLLRDLLAASPGASGLSRLDASVPALAEAGPARWWLSDRPSPAPADRRDGIASRLLLLYQRAAAAGLPRASARTLRSIDLEDTGVARIGAVALPADPRTERPFVLSGEPAMGTLTTVDAPELALQAMMMDALAREVLPRLYRRVGLDADADSLAGSPRVNDLYAAYRLRERLLETCPAGRRARGDVGRALRACRTLARLVQPVGTTRRRPGWEERHRRVGRALGGFAREVGRLDPEAGSAAIIATLQRLASLAREMRRAAAP